jgi:hypothetical protein
MRVRNSATASGPLEPGLFGAAGPARSRNCGRGPRPPAGAAWPSRSYASESVLWGDFRVDARDLGSESQAAENEKAKC